MTHLAGTNTRRVRRALGALFGGAVGKDTVSRVWRKVKSDWDAWNARALAEEPIVLLILDGTVVRARLDRKATAVSLLVAIGVRADGQKVLLAVKAMGGESTEAWRAVLDDLIRRGLRRPEVPHRRWRARARGRDRRRVGRRAGAALHGPSTATLCWQACCAAAAAGAS
jgi:putative transposase